MTYRDELAELIRRDLGPEHGLMDSRLIEANPTERRFVIAWTTFDADHRAGTHTALLPRGDTPPEAARLVRGQYFDGRHAAARALADYDARSQSDLRR